jgi:hypothetical protein
MGVGIPCVSIVGMILANLNLSVFSNLASNWQCLFSIGEGLLDCVFERTHSSRCGIIKSLTHRVIKKSAGRPLL